MALEIKQSNVQEFLNFMNKIIIEISIFKVIKP